MNKNQLFKMLMLSFILGLSTQAIFADEEIGEAITKNDETFGIKDDFDKDDSKDVFQIDESEVDDFDFDFDDLDDDDFYDIE
jgi:hypothetical protein